MPTVHLLDYVAGNIRSLVNAIELLGYKVEWIKSPEDVANAEVSNKSVPSALEYAVDKVFLTETYPTRRRPLRLLHEAAGIRELPRARQEAH